MIGNKKIAGLVLAGGTSNRMGKDKAFLKYHQDPQYLHTAKLIQNLQLEVFISCQPFQKQAMSGSFPNIEDEQPPCGPLSGILSAMKAEPTYEQWLVVGCDYPLIQEQDFQALLSSAKHHPNTAFFHQYFIPTLGCYHQSQLALLQSCKDQEQFKMQDILKEMRCHPLAPPRIENLKSFDYQEDFKNFTS